MNLISYCKYKKRVVSTLFLYVVILLLGCDFKSPEEWENPAWYTDLTLPLVNKEFSFGGLLSDTMFYSDTLDVALPGFTKKDLCITFEDNLLFISHDADESGEDFSWKHSFKKSFRLPKNVVESKINAKFEDGILKVIVPKKVEAKKVVSVEIK